MRGFSRSQGRSFTPLRSVQDDKHSAQVFANLYDRIALGGAAVGYVAIGGGAFGVHAMGANSQDPNMLEFFNRWFGQGRSGV